MSSLAIAAPGRLQALRARYFGSVGNGVLTAALITCAAVVAYPLLRWALVDAVWSGSAETCRGGNGACWAFVHEKMGFIFFGTYPREVLWQAILATALISLPAIMSLIPRFWLPRLIPFWFISLATAITLLSGGFGGSRVPTQQWGGFPLTLLLSVVGFAGAFPIGVILAFGRRSRMGLLRLLSVLFIEVVRGVPLIAVLYFFTLLFPLMLPGGASIDKLLRTQVAIVLFVSAYIAEIIRAGLESVPAGQTEAAKSLGLTWLQTQRLVMLPQGLRAVIPAFVTLGIGIFLDTTLVIVIGLFDFLNTARAAASDANWIGFYNEGYAVVAIVYFILAFGLSRYSLWLERYLRPAARTASSI